MLADKNQRREEGEMTMVPSFSKFQPRLRTRVHSAVKNLATPIWGKSKAKLGKNIQCRISRLAYLSL